MTVYTHEVRWSGANINIIYIPETVVSFLFHFITFPQTNNELELCCDLVFFIPFRKSIIGIIEPLDQYSLNCGRNFVF